MTERTNIEHITQPEVMTAYLQRLLQAHILLSVTIPGINRIFNSIIIDIDDEKQQLILDILHPDSGHEEVMKLKEFHVTAQHEGIKLGFKVYIKKLINESGKPAYLVDYPGTLIYHQQRAAYRAPVSMGEHVEIKVSDEKNQASQGEITDLSLGGMGLQFKIKESLPFKKGMLLPLCQFATPGKADFECSLEVRNVRQDSNNRFVHIGTHFVKLESQQQRQIQRFVVQLERDMIKRSQR